VTMKLRIAWYKSSLCQSWWINVTVSYLHDVKPLSEARALCS